MIGSDILDIKWNNPVLGQGTFQCKENESVTIDYGGISQEDDADKITGGGIRIITFANKASSIECVIANDKPNNTMKTLKDMAKTGGTLLTVTFIDGEILIFKNASPVGDVVSDSTAGTISVKFLADANIDKIA